MTYESIMPCKSNFQQMPLNISYDEIYTVRQKKLHHFIFAIVLSNLSIW